MRPEYNEELAWPRLAWVAECETGADAVRVRHGPQVETRDAWFCEAVWDSDFGSGDFDRTDLVFGSGGRIRDDHIVFVSSGSTVDRLHTLRVDGRTFVSNSLACLLSLGVTSLDPDCDRYIGIFRSIVNGIDAYERRIPTTRGELRLVYFRNLSWDGRLLAEPDKPDVTRDFSEFHGYHGFLRDAMRRTEDNMRAAERVHAYQMVAGLSAGYDSTTAAVIAHGAGLERAFSFRRARGGRDDHGAEVARVLGLELTFFDRADWRRTQLAEVPYFAANGLGADVVFNAAANALRGSVLVSGFHGDGAWAKENDALGRDIVREGISGLSFTEHRLLLGCIHLPVPFMGVRQVADINRISNSSELRPWDVPGDYSRPICRRIVEDAGVPRNAFGVRKEAAISLFWQGDSDLSPATRTAYHRWLAEGAGRQGGAGRTAASPPGRVISLAHRGYGPVSRAFGVAARLLPKPVGARVAAVDRRMRRSLNRRLDRVDRIFVWAVEQLVERYRKAASGTSRTPRSERDRLLDLPSGTAQS
jgi:hypothetical protein